MTTTHDLISHMRALAEAATPGPWYVQYGDDDNHMCMTAIGTENKRARNDGQFSQEEADKFVAITLHQLYPWVSPDCTNDDANSAYIAAANPATVIALLDALEHKNNLLHSFLAVLKTDRHDWEDWPSNSRNVVAAIVKELGQ